MTNIIPKKLSLKIWDTDTCTGIEEKRIIFEKYREETPALAL